MTPREDERAGEHSLVLPLRLKHLDGWEHVELLDANDEYIADRPLSINTPYRNHKDEELAWLNQIVEYVNGYPDAIARVAELEAENTRLRAAMGYVIALLDGAEVTEPAWVIAFAEAREALAAAGAESEARDGC